MMKILVGSLVMVSLMVVTPVGWANAQQPNSPATALAATIPSATGSTEDLPSPSSEYVVGPENALQIDIYYGKDQKLSQKVRVSSRGAISLPLVGEVPVAGMTVSGLQERLTQLYGQDYLVNPQITVYIEEYSTVSIMGEVKKPGAYPIKGRLTLVELLSLAEGFTKIAAPNKVKVVRTHPDGTREEIPVRVADLMNKDSSDKDNVELRAGDVVIVPESLF